MENIVKLFFIFCVLASQAAFAKTESSLEPGMVNPGYVEQPKWFKESFLDLDEDIAEAKESGKRLMIFFTICTTAEKLPSWDYCLRERVATGTRSYSRVSSCTAFMAGACMKPGTR